MSQLQSHSENTIISREQELRNKSYAWTGVVYEQKSCVSKTYEQDLCIITILYLQLDLDLWLMTFLHFQQECIPVGCVPPTHYHMGGLCLGVPQTPPGRDLLDRDPQTETPRQRTPWTMTSPPGQRPQPLDRDPTPWTETPSPRQRPHLLDRYPPHLDRDAHLDRDPI